MVDGGVFTLSFQTSHELESSNGNAKGITLSHNNVGAWC